MADSGARLLTMGLVTLVGWAALAALAVYGGLGARYTLHPDDTALAQPLPQVDLARIESRLGPIEDYAVIGERPLFNADRQPLPDDAATGEGEDTEAEAPQPLDVTLTSVILTRDVSIALLTDNKTNETQSVRLGNELEGEQAGWKLAQLEPRRAVFEGPTGRTEVELRVFDGSGGQSPTPLGAAASAAANAADGNTPADAQVAQQADGKDGEVQPAEMTPEQRAEMIRARIEERRRQMREEAARANQEGG